MKTRLQRFHLNHPERRHLYDMQAAANLLIRAGYIVTAASGEEMPNSAGITGSAYQRNLSPDDMAALVADQNRLQQLQQLKG